LTLVNVAGALLASHVVAAPAAVLPPAGVVPGAAEAAVVAAVVDAVVATGAGVVAGLAFFELLPHAAAPSPTRAISATAVVIRLAFMCSPLDGWHPLTLDCTGLAFG
jgi:hypothetical protein